MEKISGLQVPKQKELIIEKEELAYGAIISKDRNLIDVIRDYRNFDNRRDSKIRFNFQITDIQAAIGREQLQQFSEFKKRREYIFKFRCEWKS